MDWEDLRKMAYPALRHRLLLTDEASFDGLDSETILQNLLRQTMAEKD